MVEPGRRVDPAEGEHPFGGANPDIAIIISPTSPIDVSQPEVFPSQSPGKPVAPKRRVRHGWMLLVPCLYLCAACEGQEELPVCESSMFDQPFEMEPLSELPIQGLVDVTRSESGLLELSANDQPLILRFPAVDGAMLPTVGSQVLLAGNLEQTFFFTLTDPANGELLFELGDAALGPTYGGHIRIVALDEDPTCHVEGDPSVVASPEAVSFDTTSQGVITLRDGQQRTAGVDGNNFLLQVFSPFHLDGVENDGVTDYAPALMVRLAP